MKSRSLTALATALLIAACGIKGDPQPPEPVLPDPPQNFRVMGRESCALLKWKAAEVKPQEGYILLRAEVDPEHPELHAFVEREKIRPETETFTDCELEPGKTYLYQIAGISADGKQGEPTPSKKLICLPAPPSPVELIAEPGDHFVDLTWRMSGEPEGEIGFQIYRADQPGSFPLRPVNPSPLRETRWADGGLENDKKYFYQVRAVALAGEISAMEGPASDMVEAVPVDRIAPLPPASLSAVPVEKGVMLRWLPNQEPDLDGYNIYRKINGRAGYRLINEKPVKETEYIDPKPAGHGAAISYYITAVDNASNPNESKKSLIEKVFIPKR